MDEQPKCTKTEDISPEEAIKNKREQLTVDIIRHEINEHKLYIRKLEIELALLASY